MKKLLPLVAGLLSLVSSCQQKPANNTMNAIFDKAIQDDAEIKTVKATMFPSVASLVPAQLKYEPGKKIYNDDFLKLSDNRFSDKEKIQFIKDALAETKVDAFEYVNEMPVKFWSSNPEAKALIDEYFKKKEYEKSNDASHKFKYLEFRVKSGYPEAYQLITDYFATRDQLPEKFYREGDLVYQLIMLGKEEEALNYLEILADDFINKKTSWITAGMRDGDKLMIFDHLCLSDNAPVAKKATDLLFKILDSRYYERYPLFQLAAYLDKERYQQLLVKWFRHYLALDFSKMNIDELRKSWHKEARRAVPESQEYISFMDSYSKELGLLVGKQFWEEFTAKVKYTQYYSNTPFEGRQLEALEAVFANPSVQIEEKKAMLFQAVKTDQLFESEGTRDKFLLLLNQVYPGLKIPAKDFDSLQLKKVPAYALPLKLPVHKGQPGYSGFLDMEKASALVSGINSFAVKHDLQGMEANKKQLFLYQLTTREGVLYDFFKKNKIQSWFDCESASFPADYKYLFESQFMNNMGETGKELQIAQVTKKITADEYAYELYVKYSNSIYKTEFTENGTDWYYPQRLTKLINLCLAENPGTKRLVAVDTQDQTAMFLFMEPAIIKPFLDKYNIRNMAMSFEDAFSTSK